MARADGSDSVEAIVDAINDLTRVMIAIHGGFSSRSEAIRKLSELSIPPTRIASIVAMPLKDVYSILARSRKAAQKKSGGTNRTEGESTSEE